MDLGEANRQKWQRDVGKRLAHHLNDHESSFDTASIYTNAVVFIHIIQNIYTHGLKVTWGIILDTLELTHDGVKDLIEVEKVSSDKDNKIILVQVSQTVRRYLEDNYMKYYRRAKDMEAESNL